MHMGMPQTKLFLIVFVLVTCISYMYFTYWIMEKLKKSVGWMTEFEDTLVFSKDWKWVVPFLLKTQRIEILLMHTAL